MFPTERFTTASFGTRRSQAAKGLTGLSTPLDAPLLLFLLTALLGVWAAYDSRAAWIKLALIVGGLLLFYTFALQPAPSSRKVAQRRLISGVLAVLTPLTAGYFLLTQSDLPLPEFHPNVMAGIMALLLPYTLAFAFSALKHRRVGEPLVTVAVLVLTAISLSLTGVALLRTGSRGAILGLFATFCLWLIWRLRKRLLFLLLLLFSTVGSAILLGLTIGPAALLARFPSITGTVAHRLQLFRQTLHLIAEFPITGAGLGTFPGLYSEYILDIPYYMLPSSHNLLLDVALEQGLLGLLGFCGLFVGTLWLLLRAPATDPAAQRPPVTLQRAAVASIAVLLIHGLVDDPIYSSKALPLLFIAPGIAVAGSTHGTRSPLHPLTPSPFPALTVLITALGLTLTLFLSPSWQAKWFSNLGALEMARVQLAQWPTGAWSNGQEAAFLGNAEALLHRSLSLDPKNSTARHRLGLIAMMRRDYSAAVSHLSIAHAAAPGHDGIRKTLGYSYLWAGQPGEALEHLQGLPGIRSELRVYNGWWRRQDRQDLADLAGAMLAFLQDRSPPRET